MSQIKKKNLLLNLNTYFTWVLINTMSSIGKELFTFAEVIGKMVYHHINI